MAQLPDVFNTSTESKQGNFCVPAGTYIMSVVKSEFRDNKNKTGLRLMLTYQIQEGDLAGKKVTNGLNYTNANKQAQDISRGELNSLCEAVGHEGILEDTEDLHNIPFSVRATVRVTDAWGDQNNWNNYKAVGEFGKVPSVNSPVTDGSKDKEVDPFA